MLSWKQKKLHDEKIKARRKMRQKIPGSGPGSKYNFKSVTSSVRKSIWIRIKEFFIKLFGRRKWEKVGL